MPFIVDISDAQADFPEYTFVAPLTPSEQKAAFHVQDANGRDLCLKIIAPNHQIDRLQREIEALQVIHHQNVVRLVEYTFSSRHQQQRHYIIEEFVDGDDLTASMTPGTPWSRDRSADLFAMVLDGLGALDAARIVHRDLKPSNIRVRPTGEPVIIDFGLARHLDLPDLTLTADGTAIGTPCYFAPEQFSGTRHEIDSRTDIFAVGILLYETLVGLHPFWQPPMTMQQLSDAVCNSDGYLQVPAFQALPDRWQLIVSRMLDKRRVGRPRSASQVAAILRRIRGD